MLIIAIDLYALLFTFSTRDKEGVRLPSVGNGETRRFVYKCLTLMSYLLMFILYTLYVPSI